MATSTLNWYPDRGFELDVDAADDEVVVRLAGVPVPADGTDELRHGVSLDRIEILFKARVEIQGETAQLQDAHVRLVTEDGQDLLELDAHCEDVETGDVVPFRVAIAVQVPREAPASGGPRPVPTNEDDLDWEDETTLEQLVVNAPEAPIAPERGTPRRANGQDGQQKGLQALLKALASVGGDAEEDTDASRPPARGWRAPVEDDDALDDEPPPDALEDEPADEPDATVEATDQSLGAAGEARSLLEMLVDQDHLELDGEVDALVEGTRQILALPLSAEAKATRLSEWLLAQDEVADLFIGDDELAEILERW